tara:strand:+ start:1781 stop:2773 length:993 start_codon:yes stop_codon:yes gene_type:complete
MIEFEQIKINLVEESEDASSAVVELWPLVRGWGETIGTAYRRVLMSSVSGTSATFVYFKDCQHGKKPFHVYHEYQNLPGVREAVIEITQNIRAASFVLDDETEMATVELKASKAGPVTTGMIGAHPGFTIVNPDEVLFHLEEDTEITLKIGMKKNRGFIPATQLRPSDINKEWKSRSSFPAGVIRIDCSHSPVINVFPETVQERVGEDGSYQRLRLSISVKDGYKSEDVFKEATSMLKAHFERISFDDWHVDFDLFSKKDEDEVKTFRPLSELGLRPRTENALRNNGINTIEELCALRRKELKSLSRVGEVAQIEVQDKMARAGLSLRED